MKDQACLSTYQKKAPLADRRRRSCLDGVQSSTEWTGHGRTGWC